ncbi:MULTISPECIES: tRNA (adenosine(37)-N6)-threonylcarbamoyltransferase complex dimerization subunit type 1 TsaB [Terrabacteria group]|uniref:tRNA (adenosine(37)-N6)-threonylcarbamoyltransferase complex dimerization subunit type 1 TsaB n=1 Tax=Bacillati TaxID=1783272 RepID=UPI00193A80F6|nr:MULTISPECIES: tRNA (adenosine(37)-N6)-threonylcarbamoyltransferase complex dimerization subunit type 1 TsaB [Terrabacteria group]MBW9213171.1 tRNA (adenosine(37)-N6)-threonylcarbamoyltransferase complex dimerization subunit type 1 TsaB [Trueperella sp. zg.1013]QRG86814.1 tRNA (adenosine(37)-N6)-threonylcarbamoyltransferase complex dimerization subunit type 1 TsaB [Bulleidia sp. zg-1006]
MITLCLDTSMQYLVLGLMNDQQILAKIQKEIPKRQSEEIFVELNRLLEMAQLDVDDIEALVVTNGPGSYTGVRIALTIAKVFASLKKLPFYTISSLQLLAGKESGQVILDARGKRVYTAVYDHGNPMTEETIQFIEDLNLKANFIGDLQLIGQERSNLDLVQHFFDLKDKWVLQEDVDYVKPNYLKANGAYLVK